MANYIEGYYEQSTYDEEADLDAVGLKRFGYPIDEKPIIDIGITENVVARNVYGQGYQSLEAGPQKADLVNARFHPVNGKFLYWMLGKQSAATGTRTISNLDFTARKPFLTVWKRVNALKIHSYGSLIEACSFSMVQGNTPIVSLVGKGLNFGSDSYAPALAWDGVSNIKSRWDYISAMSWDGDALTPYGFTINYKQSVKPIPGYAGAYQDIDGQKPIFGTVNVVCAAAEGEIAFADWESSLAKIFSVSIGKSSAAHSMVGTHANARILKVSKTESLGVEPIYNLLLMIESASWAVTDGI